MTFGEAVNAKDDAGMANALKALVPEFENLGNAAEAVVG